MGRRKEEEVPEVIPGHMVAEMRESWYRNQLGKKIRNWSRYRE